MLALLLALTLTTGTPDDGCIVTRMPGYAICVPSTEADPAPYGVVYAGNREVVTFPVR